MFARKAATGVKPNGVAEFSRTMEKEVLPRQRQARGAWESAAAQSRKVRDKNQQGDKKMSNRPLAATLGTCLVAGTIGAGVALLFAPHSGQKTRRLIRRKAEQYIEDAKADMAEKTEELYLRGREAAENTARRLRWKLNLAA